MMKLLPIFLLLLSFNASAATPDTCLEMNRAYWLTFESFSVENEQAKDRFLNNCTFYEDEPDFDAEHQWQVGLLIREDSHIQGIIQRLHETGLLTY